jgi:hypothetical protein
MTWGFFDRVKDTSTTTGTGTVTVSGTAPTGYQTFATVYAVGDRVPYVIAHQSANEWETGRGTYTASNQIERTEVTASSNSGSAVNFSSGTKDVFVDAIAYFLNDVDTHGMVLARANFQAMP